ncbi:extracellular solute-binding protein [Spirochaeta cellobiosiphila]|uniref:extracellular solute-binding protein n=1 Tax=Spirochaeta cellobiosiphila TaxID=504483 RepID=UPI000428FAA9|nr:extracellular solute-binding protein [Spirochaeta cellobiosiphila]
MRKGFFVAIITILALPQLFANGTSETKPTTLVISTWDSNIDQFQEFLFKPFEEQYNVTIELDLGRDSDRYTKLSNERDISDIDVFLATQATAQKAIADGLFETQDKSKLSNYANLYDIAKNPNGANYGVSYTVNRLRVASKSKNLPTTWAEIFADTDSKIAIPHMTSTFGPILLWGTGDVTGDGSEAISIVENWVKAGKVDAYVSTFGTRTAVANGEYDYALLADFGYTPDLNWGDLDRVLLNGNTANIVKGSKNKELAMKFIDFLLSEEVQKEALNRGIDSPVNKTVVFEESQGDSKTNLAAFPNVILSDITVVNENRAAWVNKWNELFTK